MANRGGEDYLDKALDQAQKFAGKKVRYTNTLRYITTTTVYSHVGTGLTYYARTVRPPRRPGKVQEAEREDHGQAALDVREGYGEEGEFTHDCACAHWQASGSIRLT
jgi:hypothetical protein